MGDRQADCKTDHSLTKEVAVARSFRLFVFVSASIAAGGFILNAVIAAPELLAASSQQYISVGAAGTTDGTMAFLLDTQANQLMACLAGRPSCTPIPIGGSGAYLPLGASGSTQQGMYTAFLLDVQTNHVFNCIVPGYRCQRISQPLPGNPLSNSSPPPTPENLTIRGTSGRD